MVKKEIESAALPPLRVLILEDNPGDANLTVRLLERGGAKVTFEVTDSREVFQQRLESADFDVILADFNLRGWTAFDALEILNSSGRDIPLIVMTGTLGDEAAAECIKRGAADFILKDRPARLPAAVQRARDEKRLRTETKRAERALIEETHVLLTLMDNLPDVIYFKDLESRFTRINMALAKLFGLSTPALAVGKTDRDFFAAEHAQAAYNDEQQIIRTGQPMVDKEEKEIWPDGRVTWSSTTKMPVLDAHGNITGTFGVSRNITERKRAEEDLLFKSALLEAQSETTIDGILVVDMEDQILLVNRQFARLWRLPKDAINTKDDRKMLEHVSPQVKDTVAFIDKVRYLNSHPTEESRDELELKDGRVFDRFSSPLRGSTGKLYGRIWNFRDITENKKAESQIRASEVRYRRLFEAAHDGILILDADSGEIRDVNPFLTDLLGFSQSELLGKKLWEIGTFRDVLLNKIEFEELQSKGFIRYDDLPLETKDGRRIDVEFISNVYVADHQKVIQCNIRNNTERKHAEEALRWSEECLAAGEQLTHTGSWRWDLKSGELFWSKEAYRIFGFDPALDRASIRGTFMARIHPEDRAAVEAGLQNPTVSDMKEYRIVREDGTLRHVQDIAYPVLDAAGNAIERFGVVCDVTERKRSESERVRLATAIEQSAEAVVITNVKGGIEYVNPAFTLITGYSREEALGQNPRLLKSNKQDPSFYKQLWETILAGKPWHGELTNQRKDGTHYTEQMSIAPVRGAHGEVTHFIATKMDVTERRSLEEQLQRAAKMEAVGRLAGGVAHDFNNLLTVINGYSEILRARLAPDPKASEYLHEISGAGERAAALTRQLLAFSRRQVLAPQVLDLNAVVQNVEKMLRRLIGEDVKLRTLLDPSLGRVKADPGQVEQVLMNLAVNSRDAMPYGGNLTIETRNVELDEAYAQNHPTVKPGPHVMLAVSDSGAGMPPEVQAHIFEPFFTTKEQGKGTGLGLATVYGIVKQSEGSIWLYSEMGQGTVFKVYLPAVTESPADVAPVSTTVDSASGSETILLIEDEEGVRSLVQVALAAGGYQVLGAEDAQGGLAVCAAHSGPIHLLLTDVVMPQMSGPMVAEKIVALRPGIKVLYMSGYTDDAIVHHGVLNQGAPFIQKPFSPVALRRKVREVLSGKPKENSAA